MSDREWEGCADFFGAWLERRRREWPWLRTEHVERALVRLEQVDRAFLDERRSIGAGAAPGWHIEMSVPPGVGGYLVRITSHTAAYNFGRSRRWDAHRDVIEAELGAWPGFIDGVEACHDALVEAYEALSRRAQDDRERLREMEARARDELRVRLDIRDESLRSELRVGRHDLLELWRRLTPRPSDVRPACLSSVRDARRLHVEHPCHVYFLVHLGDVVYVGKTASAWPHRIENHLKEGVKIFDDVWFVEVDHGSLDAVEAAYIRQFRPKYNVSGNRPGDET